MKDLMATMFIVTVLNLLALVFNVLTIIVLLTR